MYNKKLVAVIKSNGKVLRELKNKDGEVSTYIPFGNEYSILIKNLHTVRVSVKVEIDGVDIGDGTRFVIQPNSSIDLERYIKAGNLTQGNKLKFIERTSKIENSARGIKVDDGLIRVEFQFEKLKKETSYEEMFKQIKDLEKKVDDQKWTWPPYKPYKPYWYYDGYYGTPGIQPTIWCNYSSQQIGQSGIATSGNICNSVAAGACTELGISDSNLPNLNIKGSAILRSQGINSITDNNAENDIGITVPGSISDQQFTKSDWFATETETHSIVLKLIGKTENGIVKEPITVKSTQKCFTCSRNNKMTSKFCVECGTSLIII